MPQRKEVIEISRAATVVVENTTTNGSGTGSLIGPQLVLTCGHIVGKPSADGQLFQASPALQVVVSGERIPATLVSPTHMRRNSLARFDIAILKLERKPKQAVRLLGIAPPSETPSIGDEVYFSGFPLDAPGMLTHRGMISNFDLNSPHFSVQTSMNQGNSGSGLLDEHGHLIGLMYMREGDLPKTLDSLKAKLRASIAQNKASESERITKDVLETMEKYISPGIGHAVRLDLVSDFLDKNPELLK